MFALAVLYLVLPFPLAFVIHDLEEVLVQHRWMLTHKEMLSSRFPRMQPVIAHLAKLNTRAFAIAAFEEWVILLVVTAYVLMQGGHSTILWTALFIAFSVHLLVHLCQAVLVRGYVPGLLTSLLLLPYVAYGMWSICLVMSVNEMLVCGMAGMVVMVVNLRFAHWLGLKMK